MGSVSKPRCARGQDCYHVRKFDYVDKPPKVGREGDLCERCAQEHNGAVRTTNNPEWMDEVLEALEAVRTQVSGAVPVGEASLLDLFELDDTPRWGRPSDLGEALTRLNARTLAKLRDWLDENTEEVVRRYPRCATVYGTVRQLAWLRQMPPDEPTLSDSRGENLPFKAMAYTRGGRRVDTAKVVRLARLRQAPGFLSERDLEKELGIPRPTVRRMIKRMDEIEFSLARFTPDDLAYIAVGRPRGRKPKPEDI